MQVCLPSLKQYTKSKNCHKGFQHVHGVEYTETYVSVVTLASVRVFLAIFVQLDLECDQMDVITAFLNGDLEEEIYMQFSARISDQLKPNQVCKLHKALYGLKQAPRQLCFKINSFLVDTLGYKSCPYEPCLYLKHENDNVRIIVLYVDDLLIAGKNRSEMKA